MENQDTKNGEPKAGSLGKRLQTAAILIVVFVLFFLLAPPWLLCILATLVVSLASWEYYEMTEPDQGRPDRALCMLLALLFPVAAFFGKADSLFSLLFLSFLVLSFRALFGNKKLKDRFEKLHLRIFGILYVGFTLSHFLLLADLDHWRQWIFALLIVIYLGDGAAYFSGSYLGKRKLAEKLSPKKTWEGAVGGLLGSLLGMVICHLLFFSMVSFSQALLVAALMAVIGQMGDLVESLIKRSCEIKDSGNILPGHGGILDRIDSVLFAVPVGYYLARIFS